MVKKFLKINNNKISKDVKKEISAIIRRHPDDFEEQFKQAKFFLSSYYSSALTVEDLVGRKHDILYLSKDKNQLMISAFLGLILGNIFHLDFSFMGESITELTSFFLSLVLFTAITFWYTGFFVDVTCQLTPYEKLNLSNYELRLIDDLLKEHGYEDMLQK